MPNPTLADIAAKAGVTKTTVSLALRNHPRISQQRKEEILSIAESLGYRPNPMVASLMTHIRTSRKVEAGSIIAILCAKGTRTRMVDSIFLYPKLLLSGIETRAKALGYSVELLEPDTEAPDAVAPITRSLAYRQVRGIIIPPFPEGMVGSTMQFDMTHFAVVAIGHSQDIQGIHRVAHNQYAVSLDLTNQLLNRGYQNIGLHMTPSFEQRTGNYYVGAFWEAHYLRGMEPSTRHLLLEPEWDYEKVIQWVKKEKLDCVISQNPETHDRLIEAGYRIPDDIGFALLSKAEGKEGMAGMFHDPHELSHAAVDLVTSQIHRNEYGLPRFPKTIITKPKWVNGTTIRPSIT